MGGARPTLAPPPSGHFLHDDRLLSPFDRRWFFVFRFRSVRSEASRGPFRGRKKKTTAALDH